MKWPVKKLGDICEIISGATPSTTVKEYWGDDFFWATPKDLSDLNDTEIKTTIRKISALGLKSCATTLLPINSVLFSSRAPIGLVAINAVPIATNQGFKNLVPNRNLLDTRYLYHWLTCNRKKIDAMGVGATFKEVSKAIVSKIEIPLPPLVEQQRIAELLDTADRILKQRELAIAKLDQLAQSVFVEMFPKHIKKLKLKDTCSFISGGTPSKDEPNFWNGDVAWISSADIEGDHVKEIRHFVTESAINNSATNPILPNNILVVTRTGVGKVVVTDQKFCFSQDITGLVLKKEFMPEFIAASIRSKQDEIVKQARGATIKGVTRDVIANVEIPAVSILEQRTFSERILQINSLKKNYELDRIKIDVLLSSLQHQSFAVN